MTKRKTPTRLWEEARKSEEAWIGAGSGTITTASTERCSYKRNEGVREATFGGKPQKPFLRRGKPGANESARTERYPKQPWKCTNASANRGWRSGGSGQGAAFGLLPQAPRTPKGHEPSPLSPQEHYQPSLFRRAAKQSPRPPVPVRIPPLRTVPGYRKKGAD